jgi:hypothetical protein
MFSLAKVEIGPDNALSQTSPGLTNELNIM